MQICFHWTAYKLSLFFIVDGLGHFELGDFKQLPRAVKEDPAPPARFQQVKKQKMLCNSDGILIHLGNVGGQVFCPDSSQQWPKADGFLSLFTLSTCAKNQAPVTYFSMKGTFEVPMNMVPLIDFLYKLIPADFLQYMTASYLAWYRKQEKTKKTG